MILEVAQFASQSAGFGSAVQTVPKSISGSVRRGRPHVASLSKRWHAAMDLSICIYIWGQDEVEGWVCTSWR